MHKNENLCNEYQQALKNFQDSKNIDDLLHILELAQKLNDPIETSRSYATLAQHTHDPKQAANYWFQAAYITATQRKEPQKAILALHKALELNPHDLQPYLLLQSCLENTEQWQQLITLNQQLLTLNLQNNLEIPETTRANTWYQIATTYMKHLNDPDNALIAINSALNIAQKPEYYKLQLEILSTYKYKKKEEIQCLENLITSETNIENKIQFLQQLSLIYSDRQNEFAKLSCMQAISFLLHRSSIPQRTPKFKIPNEIAIAISYNEWKNNIYTHKFPTNHTLLYALISQMNIQQHTNELSQYNTSLNQRLNPSEDTLINKINQSISKILGFENPPEIYTSEKLDTPIKLTLLSPAALIINPLLLSELTSFQLCYLLSKNIAYILRDLNAAYFLQPTNICDFTEQIINALTQPTANTPTHILKPLESLNQNQLQHLASILQEIKTHKAQNNPQIYIENANVSTARFAFLCAQSIADIESLEPDHIINELISYSYSTQRIALAF